MAVILLAVGVVFVDDEAAIGAVGLVALAHGIGRAVALAWPTAGDNPVSKR